MTQRDAEISSCRKYRWTLTRASDGTPPDAPTVAFLLCNPSTADDEVDDPTCVRGWGFTQAWGYSRMMFVNVNPYRSTNPKVQVHAEPWALEVNDSALIVAANCDLVVCAWGRHALQPLVDRAVNILKYITPVHYLALCNDKKTPKHPLYLAAVLRPTPWHI